MNNYKELTIPKVIEFFLNHKYFLDQEIEDRCKDTIKLTHSAYGSVLIDYEPQEDEYAIRSDKGYIITKGKKIPTIELEVLYARNKVEPILTYNDLTDEDLKDVNKLLQELKRIGYVLVKDTIERPYKYRVWKFEHFSGSAVYVSLNLVTHEFELKTSWNPWAYKDLTVKEFNEDPSISLAKRIFKKVK